MSDATPLKENVQSEAVVTGAAASEAVMQQIAGNINFQNEYTIYERSWEINGPYFKVAGAQSYVDGHKGVLFNYEVVGILMWNDTAGTSGDLELDITYRPVGGGLDVSIFTVKPKIPYTAGNNAYIFKRFTDNTTFVTCTGASNPSLDPTFAATQLTAGDILHMNIIQKQDQGYSGGITLFLRSR